MVLHGGTAMTDLSGRSLLLLFEKRSPTPASIARLVWADPVDVRARLSTLECAGLLARTSAKAAYRITQKGKAALSSGREIYV